jgi:thiol:disulfide interchange protein DsbD
LQSLLAASLVLALWGALAICAGVMLISAEQGSASTWTKSIWRRAVAAIFAICGTLQLFGAASGGSNPLQPLAHLRVSQGAADAAAPAHEPVFTKVHSVDELDAALRTAGRPVMLDFYADWCVSCKEMERFTFVEPAVQKRMSGARLLQADVTANNAQDRELLKRFQLFGPPGTIFFDPHGNEVAAARIAGFQDGERFLQTLKTAGL